MQEDNQTIDQYIKSFFSQKESQVLFREEINKLIEYQQKYKDDFFLECSYNSRYLDILAIYKIDTFFPFLKDLFISNPQRQQIEKQSENIVFQITLTNEFPLKGVRLYCKTYIKSPSISDGRDLLCDVLERRWNNLTSLTEIIHKIPQFIERIYNYYDEHMEMYKMNIHTQKLGRYYLGQIYYTSELKQLKGVIRFPCVQFESKLFQKYMYVRIILITDCHFVLYDVDEKDDGLCKCIFFADIQSLIRIQRRKTELNKLTLTWKNYFFDSKIEQEIQLSDCDKLIKEMLIRIQNFQRVKIDSNSYMNFGTQWSKEKKHIEKIIAQIEIYEDEILHIFNQKNIQILMDLYNQAIEHYSAVGDFLYDVFKNKLQNLLRRSDVQTLLSFQQDNQQTRKKVQSQNNDQQSQEENNSKEKQRTYSLDSYQVKEENQQQIKEENVQQEQIHHSDSDNLNELRKQINSNVDSDNDNDNENDELIENVIKKSDQNQVQQDSIKENQELQNQQENINQETQETYNNQDQQIIQNLNSDDNQDNQSEDNLQQKENLSDQNINKNEQNDIIISDNNNNDNEISQTTNNNENINKEEIKNNQNNEENQEDHNNTNNKDNTINDDILNNCVSENNDNNENNDEKENNDDNENNNDNENNKDNENNDEKENLQDNQEQ